MSILAGTGYSNNINPNQAGREAAKQALEAAGITKADLVLVFATVGYKQHLILEAVQEITGNSPLIGCSGEGIIINRAVSESNFNVAVGVLKADSMQFELFSTLGIAEQPVAAGEALGLKLKEKICARSRALLCFADGINFNYDSLYRGLESGLGNKLTIPFIGGIASDDWKFKATYQYLYNQVMQNSAVCLLIQGDKPLIHAIKHGCTPVGDEHRVTKAKDNAIYEIDDKPATEVIEEYLSIEEKEDWQKASVHLSIGIKAPEYMKDYDDYLIRYMPLRNLETKSLYVPTEILTGTAFFFTRRDHDKIEKGNSKLVDEIQFLKQDHTIKFILQIECIGRGQVIFDDAKKQDLLKKLQQGINPDNSIPWLGLYTYGEFAPVKGVNNFHNYSNVILGFIE